MTNTQIKIKATKVLSKKKTGGGTAVGGGINFQAATTAIVGAHILSDSPLEWLDGLCNHIPTAVWAESEGPGDDLRIELADNTQIEVQAKKGLKRGPSLWAALLPMAEAIQKGRLSYGVLVVASDSSKTIWMDLADDIERIGQGRTDLLKEISLDWKHRLRSANIEASTVCRRMRIRAVHTLSAGSMSIEFAKQLLRRVCANDKDVEAAWNCLYRQAVLLIEKRGRWVLQDLVRLFGSSDISIREDDIPASVFDRYSNWGVKTNNHFFITGIKHKIPLKYLLPMSLKKMELSPVPLADASSALEHYHKSVEHTGFGNKFDSIWTARFQKHTVVVAGPGLGKSTMLRELAHQYFQDGYLVLNVQLKPIAVAMRFGSSFSDLLFSHALDGSQISPNQLKNMTHFNWVILADGLDECGSAHHDIAEKIEKFSKGYSNARIVVTTRPIGYETPALSNWTHYSLLPPRKEDGPNNLRKLIHAVATSATPRSATLDLPLYRLGKKKPSDAISISPQLLGMSASLIFNRRSLPSTRLELYSQLFSLFEKNPVDGSAQTDLYTTVLNIIGWNLANNPLILFDHLIDCTANTLAPLVGGAPLALKKDIRLAIEHWERVGLIEKVFHDGTTLLTFIHKTFCEFAASRFLVLHSKNLLESIVAQPDKQEIIDFAIGQGLANDLIELYLRRHAQGHSNQLQLALMLIGNKEYAISDRLAAELIQHSFNAIEDGVSDKFSIGIALSDVGEKASHLVESLALSKLNAANPATKLVAWATILRCKSSNYDARSLLPVLAELLSNSEPFDISHILKKRDRGDRDLLQIIALNMLKSIPDDQARSFAEIELQDKKLQTIHFKFEINRILSSKGIEKLPLPFLEDEKKRQFATMTPIGPSWIDGGLSACKSIAKAFANVTTDVEIKRHSSLIQFSAFLRASGYWEVPVSDLYSWLEAHDEPAAHSTLKAVAQLIQLDFLALAEDAREVLHQIDSGLNNPISTIVPAVDIDPPCWDEVSNISFDRDEVVRGLLHPSSWINFLATQICVHIPMYRDEVEQLLQIAKGYSLRCLICLITEHHPVDKTQMLLNRLRGDLLGDVSAIFDEFQSMEAPPSSQLLNTTLKYLFSSCPHTALSATKLINQWVDRGISVEGKIVNEAVKHWGGSDSLTRVSLSITPLHELVQLLDKITVI